VRVNCGKPRASRAEKPRRPRRFVAGKVPSICSRDRARTNKCDDHRREAIENDVEEGSEEVTEEGEWQVGPQDELQRRGERERAAAENEGMQASETGSRCEAEHRILMRLALASRSLRSF